jgi:hypothetical protein
VQTSAGSQPKIVDGGTLVSGGLDFSGGAKHLDFTPFSATNETIFVQSSTRLTNAFSTILSGADNRAVLSQTSSSVSYNVTAGAFASISAASVEGKQLFTFNRDGTNVNCYQNGGLLGSNTTYANSSIQRSVIGRRGNTEGNYGGSIQEIIIYDTDQTDNRTALEANIGEVYGIAGIPAYEDTVNGFVETWYDQSGNGNDATQLTAGKQPKIVDAGALVQEGGNPSLEFDGPSARQLVTTQGYIVELSQNSASVFVVAKATTTDNSGYILAEGDAVGTYSSSFILNGPPTTDETLWVNTDRFGTGYPLNTQALGGFIYDGITFQAYLNGSADGSAGTVALLPETSL